MLIILIVTTLLSLLMIILNSALGSKTNNDQEKMSPFECGFNPQLYSRAPFSMQFFLIAIIFLIFDVEITLILPIPIIFLAVSAKYWMFMTIFFILILMVGLFHEWHQGALFWPK